MTLSKTTLQFCDWLIDGVTLSAQAPDFDEQARTISTARKEVTDALVAAGGVPMAAQREQPE
jgi:hypothetical protein